MTNRRREAMRDCRSSGVHGSRLTATLGLATMLIGALLAPDAVAGSAIVRDVRAIPNVEGFGERCEPPHAEHDVRIAVNPSDPNNVLVAWSQSPTDLNYDLKVIVARSVDAGASWSVAPIDHVDGCDDPLETVGDEAITFLDPWLDFGRTHGGGAIAYLTLYTLDTQGTQDIYVLTSLDGGSTWSEPHVWAGTPKAGGEHPRITAHPQDPCRAYLVWTAGSKLGLDVDAQSARVQGDWGTKFVRTSDCGETWSEPQPLWSEPFWFPHHSEILVHPGGSLLHVFKLQDNAAQLLGQPAPKLVMVRRSEDDGETWSDPVEVGRTARDVFVDPDGQMVDYGWMNPTGAVGPDGTVYVAWQDNESHILLIESHDAGNTWTVPAPIVTQENGVFFPSLAVSPDGTVGITYYDFRHDEASQDGDPSDEPLTTDFWFAHGHHGPSDAWDEVHVAGPFDKRSGYLGWWPRGLQAVPGGFAAALVMSQPEAVDGRTDVFFARIDVPDRSTVDAPERTVVDESWLRRSTA